MCNMQVWFFNKELLSLKIILQFFKDCKKKEDLFQRQNKQCIKYSKQHEFDKNTAKDLIYYFDASI